MRLGTKPTPFLVDDCKIKRLYGNTSHVDEFGRELTDSLIYDRIHHKDSIEIEKKQIFSDTTKIKDDEMNYDYNEIQFYYNINTLFNENLLIKAEKFWAIKPKKLFFS